MKSNIQKLVAYQPDASCAKIRMDANESAVDFSGGLMESICASLKELEFNRYPDTNSQDLREAFAAYVGVEASQVICGNGSDEIIRLLLETYVDKDDKIIVHDPTFSMYSISCQIAGGQTVMIEPLENFEVDIDGIIDAANREDAKVIFLCNPNNPTGGMIPREEIIHVIERTKAIIAVDEAYFEFFGESVIDLITTYDRLIVLRTMSKAFALAAARVGFGIADKPIMDYLYKVKAPYNLNRFSQQIAKEYLKHSDLVVKTAKETVERRGELIAALSAFDGIRLYPSYSNFIFFRAEKADKIKKAVEGKIALRFFGEYIRVAVGTAQENAYLLQIMKEALR